MRDISRPSWYLQGLVRDVCKHDEALDDDEHATKKVPQERAEDYKAEDYEYDPDPQDLT